MLTPAFSRVDEGRDDGAVAAAAVERLLDGNDLRVARRFADEFKNAVEAFVRVVEEDVVALDGRENVALGNEGRFEPLIGRVLQVRAVEADQGHEFAHGERALDAEDLERQKIELFRKEVGERRVRTVLHFKTDHVAEAPLVDEVLHRSEQVVGFVFLNLEVGIAGDAEDEGLLHLVAAEELVEMLADQVLNQDDVVVASVRIEAELRIGGFLRAGHEDEARHVVRALEARVADVAVLRFELDQNVDRNVRDGGERVAGVDRLRREDRIDLVQEVPLEEVLLLDRQILVADDVDALLRKFRKELLLPVVLGAREHAENAAADFGELLHGSESVRRGRRCADLELTDDVCHANHEEFIKVVVEDREELELLEERRLRIARFIKHLAVEFNPVEFAIDVKKRVVQVRHALNRRKRRRDVVALGLRRAAGRTALCGGALFLSGSLRSPGRFFGRLSRRRSFGRRRFRSGRFLGVNGRFRGRLQVGGSGFLILFFRHRHSAE